VFSDWRMAGPSSIQLGTSRMTAPRNTQRHPNCSVTRPVSSGPITDGRTHIAANNENIRGRSTAGSARATSTISETSSSPSASPLSNRPATTVGIAVAVPTSNCARVNAIAPARRVGIGPRRSVHSPAIASEMR
jgi:hypothetical protein